MNIKYNTRKSVFWFIKNFVSTCLVIGIVAGLFLSSCEEHLEEEIFSEYDAKTFFADPSSVEQGVIGIYDQLSSFSLYARGYILYFDTGTDQDRFYNQNDGKDDDQLANYQIFETNSWVGDAWAGFYNGINRANLVIDNVVPLRDEIASVSNPTSNQLDDLSEYNNLLGDAYFLRAFFYFQLVKNWGDVPLRLNSNVSLEDINVERSPSVEVYEQIETDMLLAIDLLPLPSAVKSPGRISRTAARGILSRIYLNWAGHPLEDVTKFESAAEQSMAIVNSGQHSLNSTIEPLDIGAPYNHAFPEIFKNLAENVYDLSESMWEVHFSFPADATDDAGIVGTWHGVTQDTNSSYKRGAPRRYPLPTFLASFEADDSLRRDWSISQFKIDKNDQFVPETDELEYGVGKFRRYLMPTIADNNNNDAMNWPVIRYADVLLMLAESINETIENGGTLPTGATIGTAYDAINQVRRRARALDPNTPDAGVDLVGGAGATFRQQIRDERSWELCFENQRKADLIRWGILVETVRQTGADMQAAGFTKVEDYLPSSTIQDHHVLLPIPYGAEISQNKAILNSDPTNNGYR